MRHSILEVLLGRFHIIRLNVVGLIVGSMAALLANPAVRGQTGPCCVGTTCSVLTPSACTAAGGVFQTLELVCTRDLCATPRPCCSGSFCQLTTPGQCAGGRSVSGATSCTPNPCTGSCCVNGACSVTTSSICGASSGSWTRSGTCSPNSCVGACCTDGLCTFTVQAQCTGQGVWTPGGSGGCSPSPCPAPTCAFDVTDSRGGLTTAVARVGTTALLVARGATLELYDLSDPRFPAPFSPSRRVIMPDAAVEIAMSPGASRAFVLLENGDTFYVTVLTSPTLLFGDSNVIVGFNVPDIEAEGDRVYIPRTFSGTHGEGYNAYVFIYERSAGGAPQLLGQFEPFLQNFKIDRIAKVGSTLWLGMHGYGLSTYAVEGWDVSNPAAPVMRGVIAGFAETDLEAEVTGLRAIGNRLLVSYFNAFPTNESDRVRALDVSNPAAPVWRQTVNPHGAVRCMSATGNLLRVGVDQEVQTWDTTNPASMVLLGTLAESPFAAEQISAGVGNDYIAVGRDGLQSATFTNPASPQMWATVGAFPASADLVRQSGNTTVIYDDETRALRLFDYTRPEIQQQGGTVGVSVSAVSFFELASINSGTQLLACIGGQTQGQVAVYDVTNFSLPVLRSTLTTANARHISCTNTRLYVLTNSAELKVYDLSNPAVPALLSTTAYGGTGGDYRCITSWQSGSTHAAAVGTGAFGLWLINASNGAAPQVAAVHNPVAGYEVTTVTKGPNFLYVSSGQGFGRLESLNVANLVNPVVHYVAASGLGFGEPSEFSRLTYVVAPTGRFLVAQTTSGQGVELMDVGGPLGDGVIHPIFFDTIPQSSTGIAVSADGARVLFASHQAGLREKRMPQTWAPGFSAPATSTRQTCLGGSTSITAQASASPAAITYRWFRNGSPAAALNNGPTPWGTMIAGATSPTLTISNIHAKENQARYSCEATNPCGARLTSSVRLELCIADFNCSGTVTVQDIFDFLAAYFTGNSLADVNASAGVSVQDIFDFLIMYFSDCP